MVFSLQRATGPTVFYKIKRYTMLYKLNCRYHKVMDTHARWTCMVLSSTSVSRTDFDLISKSILLVFLKSFQHQSSRILGMSNVVATESFSITMERKCLCPLIVTHGPDQVPGLGLFSALHISLYRISSEVYFGRT